MRGFGLLFFLVVFLVFFDPDPIWNKVRKLMRTDNDAYDDSEWKLSKNLFLQHSYLQYFTLRDNLCYLNMNCA